MKYTKGKVQSKKKNVLLLQCYIYETSGNYIYDKDDVIKGGLRSGDEGKLEEFVSLINHDNDSDIVFLWYYIADISKTL